MKKIMAPLEECLDYHIKFMDYRRGKIGPDLKSSKMLRNPLADRLRYQLMALHNNPYALFGLATEHITALMTKFVKFLSLKQEYLLIHSLPCAFLIRPLLWIGGFREYPDPQGNPIPIGTKLDKEDVDKHGAADFPFDHIDNRDAMYNGGLDSEDPNSDPEFGDDELFDEVRKTKEARKKSQAKAKIAKAATAAAKPLNRNARRQE
ncbi:hypothetical protein AC579_5314 [Pseudocercospora musae]|uniref:Uncharacterized protein n=1 Tax=Pseudocercospora musae TaxID=113226 RepID=A0A139HZN0_9PEZI|nr:hypothetical protein AC579_5314 [Pseudocercospora musae]